jgi:hypothetical protein
MARPEKIAEQRVLTEVSPSETTRTRVIAEKPKGATKERLVFEQKSYPKPEQIERTRIIIEPKEEFISSMLQEILNGRPPTTAQITEALNRAAIFLEHRTRPITLVQQQVLADTVRFLRSFATFLERKNQGDHLQKFIYYLMLIAKETQELVALKRKQQKRHPEESKDRVKELGEMAMERARPLGAAFLRILSLSFFNSKFRMLLLEIINLIQAMFIDYMKTKKVRPTEVTPTTPLPTSTVTTVTTTTPGPAKVTYKTIPVPTQPWVVQEPIEGSKLPKMVVSREGEAPTGQKTFYRPPIVSYQQVIYSEENTMQIPSVKEETQKRGPSQNTVTTVTFSTTEETKKKQTVTHQEEASQSAKTKLLTQKFVQLLCGFAKDPKYQEGVITLFNLMDEISDYIKQNLAVEEKVKEYATLQKAAKEARIFLEQFTSDRTLKPTVKDFWCVYEDFQSDSRLKEWVCELRDFVELLLKRPNELNEEVAYERAKDFVDRGRALFNDYKLREDVKRILLDLRSLVEGIRGDADVAAVRENIRLLMDDFVYTDKKGERRLNTRLIFDMRTVLVPLILDQMHHVPLPTIEVESRDMAYRLEDIYFDMTEILPENVFVTTSTTANVNLKELGLTLPVTSVTVHIKYIKAKIRRIRFWFKRKRILKFEDSGLLDVKLGGTGAELLMIFEVRDVFTDAAPHFHVSNIDFRIDKVKIRFHDDVKYRRIYNMGTKLGKKRIKKMIERQFEAKMRENATKLETVINGVLNQIPRIRLLPKKQLKEDELETGNIPDRLKIAKEKAIAAAEDAHIKREERRLKHLAKQERLHREREALTAKESQYSYITERPLPTPMSKVPKSQEYEISGGKVIYETK